MWKHPTEHLGEDKAKKRRSDFLAVVYSCRGFMSRTGKNQNSKNEGPSYVVGLESTASGRVPACFCALRSNFCLKESLGKGEAIRMLREKIVKKNWAKIYYVLYFLHKQISKWKQRR